MAGEKDNSSDSFYIALMVLIAVLVYLANDNFHIFVEAWAAIRLVEFKVLSFLGVIPNIDQGIELLSTLNSKKVTLDIMTGFDKEFSIYLSWLPGVILLYVGVKLTIESMARQSKYDINSLLGKYSKHYSYMSAYNDNDPNTKPIEYSPDDPSSAEEGTPYWPSEYIEMIPPPGLEEAAKTDPLYMRPIYSEEEGFSDELAELSFASQLGSKFTGVEDFSEAEKIAYDIIIDRVHYDSKTIKPVLKNIAEMAKKSPNLTKEKAGAGFKKWELMTLDLSWEKIKKDTGKNVAISIIVQSILSGKQYQRGLDRAWADYLMLGHGFNKTILMTLINSANFLDGAGDDKIIAPGSMPKIIKRLDRPLWYALQSAGRRVSFPEGGGIYSHWIMEKSLGFPLFVPEVTEAIEGIKKVTVDREPGQ